ncbi:Penicillin-binding protein 4* [Phycisphaerae bacterium RAS1]|nr:Penicillin-binding protein 4* [Phycisphaerae bacterium RAS1]
MKSRSVVASALCLAGLAIVARAIDPPKWATPKAASAEQLAAEIDGYIKDLEKQGLNGIVLITYKGKDLLHKAYGLADRESGRKMTVETGSCIGSIVKPITKAAIIKLESEGKLRLDDVLPRFFDNVPPDKAEITLQQVLDHKAGFPDIFGDDYEPATKEWVIEKLMTTPLIAKPGEKESYSNAGYSLLGAVIEKLGQMPYEKYVHSQLFVPAGTPRIGYLIPGWKNEELAVGYKDGKRWGTPLDHPWMADGPSWNLRCNGGMIATVRDLHSYFDAVLGGRVLSAEGTKSYRKQAIRKRSSGEQVIGSVGGNGITNSIYVNLVDDQFVFVMFTSVAEFESEEVFKQLKQRILDFVL